MESVLETKRLLLRRLERADFGALCEILQDAEVMYAYEHAFSDEEVRSALAWGSEKIGWFADVLLRGDVRACKKGIVRALNMPLGI